MRLLIRISVLLLIGFHLKGQHVYENVIFQKINEVKLTRSEWKIACVFEIQTIIDYVQLISKDICQVNQIILNVERDYKQSTTAMALIKNEGLLLDQRDNSGFSQTFSQMRNEIRELTLAHQRLQTELQSYAFLGSSSRNQIDTKQYQPNPNYRLKYNSAFCPDIFPARFGTPVNKTNDR